MIVSQKFIAAVKLNHRPAYEIAWEAGVNPNTLSKLLNGIEKPRPDDPRVIAIGQVLNIPPNECFQETREEAK